ncbi:MAG: cytochrome c oxidase assembly protein [Deltaproteobacteria bacterium]|nr:cytochrome c oxidase assembly protein [Deltaproteobacteria bacterium]
MTLLPRTVSRAAVSFGAAAVLCACAWGSRALAHPGKLIQGRVTPNLTPAGEWFVWDFHESIAIGTVVLAAAYAWALRRWHPRRKLRGAAATRAQQGCYYGGLAVMYVSLDGPLHHLADELLFSAHMLQHMLLQLVWAPLIILGVPAWLWQALYELPGAGAFARFISRPWPAFWAFQAAMWVWHLPRLYTLALEVHAWHIVEHLCFMVTAVVFWFVVIAPLPQLARSLPKRMAFIFLNMTAMKTLGLILTMSSVILYPFYVTAPRVFGIDVLSDQQVGGMIMWMPGGGLMWFGVGRVFWLWVHRATPQRGLTGIARLDRGRAAAELAGRSPDLGAPDLAPDDQPAVVVQVTP